ncbi:IS4 family transposase [bacterium]|nr:MAG: IS4 family transposase [bacterium]
MEIAASAYAATPDSSARKSKERGKQCPDPATKNRANAADCNEVLTVISRLISTSCDPQFRDSPRDFSRGGPLTPELLTTLLLYMVADNDRRGYRHLLDGFWDEARSFGLELPTEEPISAPSFCTARRKITSEHLRYMLHELAASFTNATFGSASRWHGRRVFALDGTKVNLQRSPELDRAFGVPEGCYCPQVLVSVLLDVCAKIPVDLEVSPYASSEREHFIQILPSLERGDVLVLDRGYPSHEVLQELVLSGIDFLIRVPSSHSFAAIDELRESGSNDRLLWLTPPAGSPPEWEPIEVRVVRLCAPDGSESFFVTSLRRSLFTRRQLRELYHMRWEAEEFYKLFKGPYIGQGQFRSRSADGVVQEIHALVLFLAISRSLMAAAAKATGADNSSLSQKSAVLGLAAYVTRLFLTSGHEAVLPHLHALLHRIARVRHNPRPGRSHPRVSFRPRLRWGPSGRCGG